MITTAHLKEDGCVFQTLKEHRGTYFTQYTPARAGDYFASLSLVFTEKPAATAIPAIMEQESKTCVQRYSVPIFVTAFSDTDDVISLEKEQGCDHLTALPEMGEVSLHWRLLKNEEFPAGPLTEGQLRKLYADIPCTTLQERRNNALASARSIRIGITIIALWGLIVPAAVALVGLASPILGGIVIAYSISKAVWQTLKMLGYVGRSEREKQKDAEELRMRHHHYHCERNPQGFIRLKTENLEREIREETRCEAEELKRRQNTAEADE